MRQLLQTLIVDDNTTNLKILARTLKCHFSELIDTSSIVQAEDGYRALAAYRSQRFDLILLDIDMPGMSGTEVAKEIRQMDKDIIIIACTTSDSPASRQTYSRVGMDGCVCKPLDLRELTECLLNSIRTRTDLQLSREVDLFVATKDFLWHAGSPPDVVADEHAHFARTRALRRASVYGPIRHLRSARSHSEVEEIDTSNISSSGSSSCSCSSHSDINPFDATPLSEPGEESTSEPRTPCACQQLRREARKAWQSSAWHPFTLEMNPPVRGSRSTTRTCQDSKNIAITGPNITDNLKSTIS